MIGCMAKATSDALNVDYDEMEEVRWVSREEAARAVLASQDRKNPYPSAPLTLSLEGYCFLYKLQRGLLPE